MPAHLYAHPRFPWMRQHARIHVSLRQYGHLHPCVYFLVRFMHWTLCNPAFAHVGSPYMHGLSFFYFIASLCATYCVCILFSSTPFLSRTTLYVLSMFWFPLPSTQEILFASCCPQWHTIEYMPDVNYGLSRTCDLPFPGYHLLPTSYHLCPSTSYLLVHAYYTLTSRKTVIYLCR